jgi:hypothetical protein
MGPAGGNGDSYSIFLGASASASRIFFGTAEGLVPSDVDGQWDIYAADVPTLSPPADNPTGTPGDGGKSGDGTTHPTTKPRCVVPAIKNVTLVRARQRLATHHCRLGRVRLRASARRVGVAKRRVASQSPHAGAVRPERARVSVWLAAGNRL